MTYQSSTSGSISVASREMVANIHRYVRWIFPLSSLDGGGSLYGVRGVKLIGSKKLIGGTSSVQESWVIFSWCLIRSSIHSKISILNFYSTFNRLYVYIYIYHTVRIITMRIADLVWVQYPSACIYFWKQILSFIMAIKTWKRLQVLVCSTTHPANYQFIITHFKVISGIFLTNKNVTEFKNEGVYLMGKKVMYWMHTNIINYTQHHKY